jgi:phosphatidylserine/phosphatidylglycerophosphate/cardiolipin synthase-like enzyme
MLRTVSVDASTDPFQTKRDDIIRVYKNLVQASQEYLYLENQYFRDQTLADQIAARAKANSKLIGIFVVVRSAADDDKDNEVTRHGNYLQNLFFRKISAAFGSRCGIYTMIRRAVHSKLMIVDDRAILGGSANGNARSFVLDSELNLSIRSEPLAKAFKERLWAHNLGLTIAQVAGFSDPIAEWNKIAIKNEPFVSTPTGLDLDSMSGEGLLKFDFNLNKGKKSLLVPDEFAYMDFNNDISPNGEGALPRSVSV